MKAIKSIIAIMALSFGISISMQAKEVSGTVTSSEDGSALPGVSVVEKGTTNGAVTDYNGQYHLVLQTSKPVLMFSYVGMETKEVEVGEQQIINVSLTEDALGLNEVIVTGTSSRIWNRTNSVKVEAEEFSADAALQGRVAGVQIRGASRIRDKKSYNSYQAQPSYYYPPAPANTESYAAINENGYKDVFQNPLSTFSIDVDKASYANVRRFINQGQLPPEDAVRIEEMVNYFSYDYPEPEGEHPFTVSTELSECPWNTDHQLLHIGLKGMDIEKENLPPSNLVFLVDVSGSMNSSNKLPLLKSAFRLLVNELRPQDRVAIVVYAGAAGQVLESTPGNKKSVILSSMNRLQAGGSTAGGEGLKLAYAIAEENFVEEGNNRIILATDGDFNVGASSDAAMERLIEQQRDKGVFLTVLGFGMGNFKDSKMEILADKGNGNYSYIDNIQEANKVFVQEFGGTLFTIAKDVKFQIEFNPARVAAYRLVGYENRLLNDEDFNDDKKDAGEMGAGHTVTALYEIIPTGTPHRPRIDPLKYQETDAQKPRIKEDLSQELMTVKLRYKKPDGKKSTLYEMPVQGKLRDFDRTSDNFRFAAAVAEYGMILRNSDYLEEGSLNDVLRIARGARGEDLEGYRGEFIKLVSTSNSLLATRK